MNNETVYATDAFSETSVLSSIPGFSQLEWSALE